MKSNLWKAAALILALSLLLSACGASAGSAAASAAETAASAAETAASAAESAAEAAPAEAPAGGSFRTVEDIQAAGSISIGVFSDKAPFGYVDENGAYQGYDVYFAERIGKDLGVSVEYVPLDPASRVEFVQTGKVDIVLANFTVTPERAEAVDFCLPYMKVALGVVSPDGAVITDVSELSGKELIVCKGTTAETYFEKNYPEVTLQKYDQYADAYNALLDGRGDALSTDNTEVLAWAIENPGFTVGIETLGSLDTIAPAVQKGNDTVLTYINQEIEALAAEQFFHADYEATLKDVYGDAVDPDNLVVEGGAIE